MSKELEEMLSSLTASLADGEFVPGGRVAIGQAARGLEDQPGGFKFLLELFSSALYQIQGLAQRCEEQEEFVTEVGEALERAIAEEDWEAVRGIRSVLDE